MTLVIVFGETFFSLLKTLMPDEAIVVDKNFCSQPRLEALVLVWRSHPCAD